MSGNRRLPGIFLLVSFFGGLILFSGCVEDPTLAFLSTGEASEITVSSAVITGEVTKDGGAHVTARGICWGTEAEPNLSGNFKSSGTGLGEFTCNLDGLDPNTEYHARAYAENSVGIAYGNEVTFTTSIGAPTVTTGQVSDITATGAVCGGTITYDGGAAITEKGVCWSTTPDPDLQDSHTSLSAGAETFSCALTNLSGGTRYYARAYVKNASGTAYGNQIIFNTKLADIEGNLYGTINIGTQVWMSENLRATKLNDNSPVSEVTENTIWINLSSPAYCWFLNDVSYKSKYGALYNWFTVGTGKICPTGWHVPSDEEFKILELYLGLPTDQLDQWDWRGTDQGSQMKSTTGWDNNGNGTNSSGFSALAGGYRYGATGAFNAEGELTYWWAYDNNDIYGWYRRLDGDNNGVFRGITSQKGGKYIRCIKD